MEAWLTAVGQKADRRRARAARQTPLRRRCRRGYLWLAGGLTQAAGVGYETSGPFEPFFWGLPPGLSPAAGAVRPVVLDRFTRTGSEDGGALPSDNMQFIT